MFTRCSCLFFLVSLMAGCFQQDSDKTSQMLPPDYSSNYVLARNCRYSIGHKRYLKVLSNSKETNDAYLAGNCLLPVNSLVLAEEYDKADCSSLVGYTLMRKDPGYDPSHNDWNWQELDDMRNVLKMGHNQTQTCVDCHQKCSTVATPEYTCSR
jgi:hypothetical protein